MMEFNLLVVDDDRIYLDMVKLLFEEARVKVLCADSGEEALEIIKEKPIGLIFTDFNMPGMDGLELAVRVREIVPDARIVMTTSDQSPEIITLAMRAGISRVVAKPFDLTHILDIIDGEKKWLIDSLREAVSAYTREVHAIIAGKEEGSKKEAKPSEGTGKEEHHSKTTWMCPACGARYTGWSTLNRCSKCGYEE
ncbi:MAG: response regulator [Deltaproteobacteria bacterium]|nr:response regulator [Deltaproteobacteria bacterium]